MAQGIDDTTKALMPGFQLPINGSTEIVTSTLGAVVNSVTPVVTPGFYEFTSTADCFVALGVGAATIPAAGLPGGMPIPAATPKVAYYLPAGAIVSAIGAAAFSLYITKV